MIEPLLQTFSKIINSYLNLDPESKHRLQRLQGKIVSVELLPLQLTLHYHFDANGVHIHDTITENSQATIKGTPLQMLNVMINKDNRQQFFAEDLQITGDADAAHQVIKLFDDMHVDLENELARFVGDKAAYHVSNLVRNTKNWLLTTMDAFTDDVNEYIHEESKLFPPNEALTDFFNDIDELRMDVDRFAIKVEQLQTQISQDENQTPIIDEGAQ